jgi:hypothetical protein
MTSLRIERQPDQITGVWPKYNEQGDVLGRHWGRLDEDFRDFQFFLYDNEREQALAHGHSIPLRWDGTVAGLPAGIDAALDGAVRLFEEGGEPNALSALAIEIPPEHQGGGYSRTMIGAMLDIAAGQPQPDRAIAPPGRALPLRQSTGTRWTRSRPSTRGSGSHVRLGAEILRPVRQSLRITGSVAKWEEWTETPFPESGTYVFPRCLAPLEVDREADLGSYWEPNVWVRHRVP